MLFISNASTAHITRTILILWIQTTRHYSISVIIIVASKVTPWDENVKLGLRTHVDKYRLVRRATEFKRRSVSVTQKTPKQIKHIVWRYIFTLGKNKILTDNDSVTKCDHTNTYKYNYDVELIKIIFTSLKNVVFFSFFWTWK